MRRSSHLTRFPPENHLKRNQKNNIKANTAESKTASLVSFQYFAPMRFLPYFRYWRNRCPCSFFSNPANSGKLFTIQCAILSILLFNYILYNAFTCSLKIRYLRITLIIVMETSIFDRLGGLSWSIKFAP